MVKGAQLSLALSLLSSMGALSFACGSPAFFGTCLAASLRMELLFLAAYERSTWWPSLLGRARPPTLMSAPPDSLSCEAE